MILWINCAKFMAILAVMVDHTAGILYTDAKFHWASFYSVSLFILISGMLSYRSNSKHNYSYGRTVVHSLKKIVIAYILATFIYHIFTFKAFDLVPFLRSLVFFNASGPLYYVLLYIHLMLINKVMYNFIAFKTRAVFIKDLTVGYVLVAIAYMTTNYSNILNVYGGGGEAVRRHLPVFVLSGNAPRKI